MNKQPRALAKLVCAVIRRPRNVYKNSSVCQVPRTEQKPSKAILLLLLDFIPVGWDS